MNIEVQGLFNDEELLAIGEQLELDSSAAVLVWENVWARRSPKRSATQVEFWSRSSASRTTPCRQRASGRWKRTTLNAKEEDSK